MPVYVDNAQIPYGRMKMSHMLADTNAELLTMVKLIKLDAKHIQSEGMENEHFDISKTYRDKAIKEGAIAVTSRELVGLLRRKRAARLTALANPIDADVTDEADEPDFRDDEDLHDDLTYEDVQAEGAQD